MTIKYEPIFGDQSLFNNAPDTAEMIGGLTDKCSLFIKEVNGTLYASFGVHDAFEKQTQVKRSDIVVRAMRRIIKTPTWTRADQEAGVLPPVGVKCFWADKSGSVSIKMPLPKVGTEVRIIAHSHNLLNQTIAIFEWYEEGHLLISGTRFSSDFSQIETPEEKAARLKDEWCIKAAPIIFGKQTAEINPPSICYPIYDALLSGALKAPTNE